MTQNCLSFDQFIAYKAGELSQDDQFTFESHLSQCDHCLNKFVESYELIQDPTIDQQEKPLYLPDISKIARWIGEQIAGIFDWRPFPDFYDMGIPVLQTVRAVRNNDSPNVSEMPTGVLMKASHEQFYSQVWIEKKDNNVNIWVRVQFLDSTPLPVFITLRRDNQQEYVRTMTNDAVMFTGIPFGHYSIVVETDESEEIILRLKINDHHIERIPQ
ncbi:MAG: zf-HC2 domain-containing protein [Candidatus Magnetomorum sp.]|nr:zf-HC2 domain-containing protein [Candidatus Magnetomorum sp.]